MRRLSSVDDRASTQGRERRAEEADEPPPRPAPSIRPPRRPGPGGATRRSSRSSPTRIVEAQRPIRVLQALRWDDSVEEHFLKTKAARAAEGRRGVLRDGRPRLRPARQGRGVRGHRPRHRPRARRGGRDRQHHADDGARVPRRRAHARRARHAGVLRLLAQALRLAEGQVPRRQVTVRDLGHAALRHPHERRRAVAPRCRSGAAFDARRSTSQRGRAAARTSASRATSPTRACASRPTTRSSPTPRPGSDYVKVRTGAKFSPRDIDILEVHEGWVHVATSLNGQAQPVAKWLAKGPPRTDAVQEGLAALLEIFTFRTYPAPRAAAQRSRARRRQGRGRRVASSTSSSGSAPRATTRRSASTTRAASSAAASSRGARRSRRTPATARGSSSTTRSSAAPSSTTAPTSSRSSSSARSPTRTCPVLAQRVSRRRRPAAALPAADVPRPQRPRDLDGVLDVLLAARRRGRQPTTTRKLFARTG